MTDPIPRGIGADDGEHAGRLAATRSRAGRARGFVVGNLVGLVRNPGIKFVRDLGYLMGAQVAGKVIGLLVFAYFARRLSAEGYGAVESLLAVTGFALLLVDFHLGTIGVRERNLGRSGEAIVNEVPIIRLLIALMCMPAVILAILATTDDPAARTLGFLFSGTVLLHAWKQEWLLQSMERLDRVAVGQLLRVFILAALVLMLVTEPGDLIWVGVAELASVALWIGFLLREQLRAGLRPGWRIGAGRIFYLLKQAAPLGVTGIIWGAVQFVPPVLVAMLAGLEQAAYFAAAQRIVTSLQSLSYVYYFSMYPALIRRFAQGVDDLLELLRASTRVVAWATVGPAVLCAAHGAELYALAFGAPYRSAGLVLSLLIFVVPIQLLSGHQRWALTTIGRPGAVLAAGSAGAAVAVIGALLLVPFHGSVGAAVSNVLATIAIWGVAAVLCRRNGLSLAPWVGLVRPATLAIAVHFATEAAIDAFWAVQFAVSSAAYVALSVLADRELFPDLRRLAYAKKHLAPAGAEE